MRKMSEEIKKEIMLRMNENTPRIIRCLNELSEEEVWQRPNTSSNSIGNLILHLCGNIRQYAIASLGSLPDERQRSLEFTATGGFDKRSLIESLSSTVEEACATIHAATEEELMRVRKVQAFEMSGIGIMVHVAEHYSYHTGQIAFFTKLLKDRDLGFYQDVALE